MSLQSFCVKAVVSVLCSDGWTRVVVCDSFSDQEPWVTNHVDVDAWGKLGLPGNDGSFFGDGDPNSALNWIWRVV
jgi:hypothetical protein